MILCFDDLRSGGDSCAAAASRTLLPLIVGVSFRFDSISLPPAGDKMTCIGPPFHHRPFSHNNGLRSYKPCRADTSLVIQMPYGPTFCNFSLLWITGPSPHHPPFLGSGGCDHKPFGSFLIFPFYLELVPIPSSHWLSPIRTSPGSIG